METPMPPVFGKENGAGSDDVPTSSSMTSARSNAESFPTGLFFLITGFMSHPIEHGMFSRAYRTRLWTAQFGTSGSTFRQR
jgi:hypothetical protein